MIGELINLDLRKINTPCYIIDESKIIKNLEVLDSVQKNTGCKILLAQKAFSNYALYPQIGKYLKGTAASGLYEARLGREEMGGEVHVFSPAYLGGEFEEIAQICDYIIFNSIPQFAKFRNRAPNRQLGLRINPEYSEIENALYDPCAPNSRFGAKLEDLKANPDILSELNGLHFHTMCEQNSDVLKRTIDIIDEEFSEFFALPNIKWINFGGGHHITREDYDLATLEAAIVFIRDKYNVEVYLEPGEAIALKAGVLAAQVLDFVEGDDLTCTILDASAACHMPDVLEVPYTPEVIFPSAGMPNERKFSYRFGGNTCLSGDIIGDYSFDDELQIGDKIIFGDMAHYTTVKNNTFNGMKLPNILLLTQDGSIKVLKEFGYEDFKGRL